MKKIEIEIPDNKKVEWVDGVLTLVDEKKPKDVTERIKTFGDALNELGENHSFVLQYNTLRDAGANGIDCHDISAYLKLRIICAALNEDWQPKLTKAEWRYYPWFWLYTKTEIENMSEAEKKNLVIIDTGDYDTEYAGLAFAHSYYAPSDAASDIGAHICLKSEALATYCGKQFIDLWADYLLRRK